MRLPSFLDPTLRPPVRVTSYHLCPVTWVAPQPLRIAILADLHGCTPWVPVRAVHALVDQILSLEADLILLPGDFAGHAALASPLAPAEVAAILARLSAPLGVYAVMGNHDWKDDPAARKARHHDTIWHRAFEAAGLPVLSNRSLRLSHHGTRLALAGIDSQRAYGKRNRVGRGADDVEKALDGVPHDMFTILMAHEPDIFHTADPRIDLTISGHTHGGQIRPLDFPLVVPSDYGRNYAYGHYQRGDQSLVVSGGIGYSGPPLRLNMPPEITLVTLA